MSKRFLVVGAGFSGAVLAHNLAQKLDCKIDVVDERPHVAGNCYTERDPSSGVMRHVYGPHIFNTNRSDVWEFVIRHAQMIPYINRVKAVARGEVFSLPINLHTINQFFHKSFSPAEAQQFITSLRVDYGREPENFEEQALALIGEELYQAFFYGYTKKQWGCEPTSLPASIIKRLPIRFNYDDNYYNAKHQGIPSEGYTYLVEKILAHENIAITTSVSFEDIPFAPYDHVFYTGPIDRYYNFMHGRLGYRTVKFDESHHAADVLGTAVLNYTEANVPFTRVHSHNFFAPWETHSQYLLAEETSFETTASDIPYYPKRLADDKAILAKYVAMAEIDHGVSFLGRLGTYRYINMDVAIGEALDFSDRAIGAILHSKEIEKFSAHPLPTNH